MIIAGLMLVALTLLSVTITDRLGGSPTHGLENLITRPSEIQVKTDLDERARSAHVIEIRQFKFIPDLLETKIGDTIMFVNNDFVPHDIREEVDNKWTSSILEPGNSWSMIAIENADYFCSLHVIMKGKIKVSQIEDNS